MKKQKAKRMEDTIAALLEIKAALDAAKAAKRKKRRKEAILGKDGGKVQ